MDSIWLWKSTINHDQLLHEMWNKQFDLFHTCLTDSDILRRQSVELRGNPLERNYTLIYKQKTKLSSLNIQKENQIISLVS